MKILFSDASVFFEKSSASIQPGDVDNYLKLMRLAGRAAIYGWPVCLALWVFIVFPDVGLPAGRSEVYGFLLIIPIVILLVFLHEIVHLLALPNRIFRPDTYLVFDIKKPLFHMGLSTKVGGRITREQFIWISLLPLIVFTVIPFGFAVFAETKPAIHVGILASANFALSTADLIQSAIVFWEGKRGQVLREA
ncbi:MAG: DUF3267 domain-containing protein [Rhodocyclaceae bacterium]|nr:DUF3267 domain-containing protein [Rhodocyclaceae bacterium]MCA3034193.1 DUF3267 domain-containing protein [Rhodocyclaceae bacterium]MCA3059516.1 DUF3267 domain-containing protein [Rhodocyclaceae bacterium]MCA3083359.1 DUF3267 domain-containing protein [Rhodocyclaceae bacterium]